MGATNYSGPLNTWGDLDQIISAIGGTITLPDPNTDRGPCMFFAGYGLPDVRLTFPKDHVTGWTGKLAGLLARGAISQVNTIPIAHATAGIAALQNTVNGTPMTLVTSNAAGFTCGIPICPLTGPAINATAPVNTGVALDWGFAFGNVTANSTTIVVADSTQFYIGMPLVIAAVGGATGTTPLLTNVASITDATHIVVTNTPLQSVNPTPIGTGNLWGPSELGYPLPTAAAPYIPMGPSLLLDPRQALGRGVVVTCNNASGAGGIITVSGYDVYGMPMTDAITITPGSSLSAYGLKAFKYIVSATPNFTDATYTYSLGTSDVFGFNIREDYCEETVVWWAGALNAATTGYVAPDTTNPATSATGDVRGTIQVSGIGGSGSGVSSNASNGTISTLALSGRRVNISGSLTTWDQLNSKLSSPQFMFGQNQA